MLSGDAVKSFSAALLKWVLSVGTGGALSGKIRMLPLIAIEFCAPKTSNTKLITPEGRDDNGIRAGP